MRYVDSQEITNRRKSAYLKAVKKAYENNDITKSAYNELKKIYD